MLCRERSQKPAEEDTRMVPEHRAHAQDTRNLITILKQRDQHWHGALIGWARASELDRLRHFRASGQIDMACEDTRYPTSLDLRDRRMCASRDAQSHEREMGKVRRKHLFVEFEGVLLHLYQ